MHLIDFAIASILPPTRAVMSKHLIRRHPDTTPVLPAAPVRRATGAAAQALVAVVIDGKAPETHASTDLAHWKLVNPLADWIVIDIAEAPRPERGTWLQRKLSELLDRKRMQFGQLVLLGRRDAGRLALDLILDGALGCAGFVGIDIPSALPRAAVASTTTSIRLVLHGGDAGPGGGGSLIDMLRRADVDIRIMRLPAIDFDGVDTTIRAASTFLFELVAKACRNPIDQQGSHHV
jgi:hypothetical protein